MIIVIESVILCILFTIMVYIMSREPIKTLYNYPPKIQERVKSLEEYKASKNIICYYPLKYEPDVKECIFDSSIP